MSKNLKKLTLISGGGCKAGNQAKDCEKKEGERRKEKENEGGKQ